MVSTQWHELLMLWSADILASELAEEKADLITPEMISSQWLGYPGATDAQIVAAEARLGTHLPPSYRTFLSVSNGWSVLTQFAVLLGSTTEIGWLRDTSPTLFTRWSALVEDASDADYFVYGSRQDHEVFRTRYLHTTLQLSDPQYLDGELYLLNPQVVTPDGEWEAWFCAFWLPGVVRYRSFWELMKAEYEDFFRSQEELTAATPEDAAHNDDSLPQRFRQTTTDKLLGAGEALD